MPAHRRTPSGPAGLRRFARLLVAAGLLAAAGAIFWQQSAIRDAEIDVAGRWFGLVLDGEIYTAGNRVYFQWTDGPLIGLRNTWECTVALLAGPLCAIGGVLLGVTRLPAHRLLIGLTTALIAVAAVNQLRLLMIAFSLQRWGMPGYDISHKVIGSLFALAGFAAGLILLFKIASKQPGAGHRSDRAIPGLG